MNHQYKVRLYVVMISIHDVAVVVTAPSEGPVVRLNGKPGRNEAELVWTEIPQAHRRGFITNYTIFYTSGTELHSMYLSHGFLNRLEFLHLQLSI